MIDSSRKSNDNEVGIIVNNSVLYNAMIHPFTRMVIKGALWYQGTCLGLRFNYRRNGEFKVKIIQLFIEIFIHVCFQK